MKENNDNLIELPDDNTERSEILIQLQNYCFEVFRKSNEMEKKEIYSIISQCNKNSIFLLLNPETPRLKTIKDHLIDLLNKA